MCRPSFLVCVLIMGALVVPSTGGSGLCLLDDRCRAEGSVECRSRTLVTGLQQHLLQYFLMC